jgi:Zn-dependent peptidase ImmA (M78 family)
MEPNYKKAEQLAVTVLSQLEINDPIVPVDEIAQRQGLSIKSFKPDDDEEMKKVSGFYDPESKTIYVNADDAPTRQLFTIAHELGHMMLGHEPGKFSVLYRFATPIDKDPIEQEANCFAANLLVPKNMLTDTMRRYGLTENDTKPLASLFGVSIEVMKYRLQWMRNEKNF